MKEGRNKLVLYDLNLERDKTSSSKLDLFFAHLGRMHVCAVRDNWRRKTVRYRWHSVYSIRHGWEVEARCRERIESCWLRRGIKQGVRIIGSFVCDSRETLVGYSGDHFPVAEEILHLQEMMRRKR